MQEPFVNNLISFELVNSLRKQKEKTQKTKKKKNWQPIWWLFSNLENAFPQKQFFQNLFRK